MSLKNGLCPHCGKQDIRYRKEAMYFYRGGSGMSITPLTTFICVSCGFVESYVRHENHLEDVAQTWDTWDNVDDAAVS